MLNFTKYIDLDYSLDCTETLISFASNPDLGFRTGGSEAEYKAADFIEQKYKEMGLSNVHKEKVTVDTFEFKRGDIVFKNVDGEETKALIAAFQTTCQATDEEIEIVYINRGRDVDYEGVDVKGKFVLIDIDMTSNWWINWPMVQARIKGAAGLIAVNVTGYCSYSEECIGTQDCSAPTDMPAFSMSVKDANILKTAISALGGNSIKAILNADALTTKDGYSYNVIGEIPGETDEIIYVIGHYDAYFRAFDDNSAGIGCLLGIVNAFMKEGYKPKRTLRCICHGAEEWGIADTRYDWARGAVALTWNHPEWRENGFMLLNLDGNTINSTATAAQVRTNYELVAGIEKIAEGIEGSIYPFCTNSPMWTWTESYMYAQLGIPTIECFYEGVDFWPFYHSTHDLKEIHNYSDDAYRSSHILYGSFLQEFDKLKVRPIRYADMLDKLAEAADACPAGMTDDLKAAIAVARESAEKAYNKDIDAMSDEQIIAFNKQISKCFSLVANDLFGLDWFENYDFLHVRNANNVAYMADAIAALEAGNVNDALQIMKGVDLTKYGYAFDYDTFQHLIGQVLGENHPHTWADGKVESCVDLWADMRSLMTKRNGGDTSAELAAIKAARDAQLEELAGRIAQETELIKKFGEMLEEAAAI